MAARRGDHEVADQIKRLAIVSVFAEDEFLDLLVLKGGNALDLVLGVTTRASMDVDLSMPGSFSLEDIDRIRVKLESSIVQTFASEHFVAFDMILEERPEVVTEPMRDYWGGYRVTFKVIRASDAVRLHNDIHAMRREAILIGGKGKLQIDISKFEFTDQKQVDELDGYQIYVYSPAMIVAEKLRAICQQLPAYVQQVHKHTTARARDFVDIHATIERFRLDMSTPDHLSLVRSMFEAKRVPLQLLAEMESMRAFHREDFLQVQATVRPGVTLQEFDFYFDFVRDLGLELHSLGNP